jgi:ATP-dependent RNA helicase DDX35
MTTVQVSIQPMLKQRSIQSHQDVFVIPEGAPGALAELERRKFTAEEGVRKTCV